uniref:Uncharacterized protein n=1 Tax=Caenorhabditis japonica TaxID=281687 RepID=A0A8R1E9H4_CAEJA
MYIMLGMTNASMTPIVSALKVVAGGNHLPVVRMITATHREQLEASLRTDVDYLIIQVFKKFLRSISPEEPLENLKRNKKSIVRYSPPAIKDPNSL